VSLQSFTAQWDLDELPACPIGIDLLYSFSQSVDEATFRTALQNYESGIPVDSQVKDNPLWHAYSDHSNKCDDCNEV
jgi:hypothetical protein